ncbi:uncharacterized protein F5891DRAFT_1193123 [Suillus fuscotomentosus]|uniref:Uncharacterized protein n=1 Tax=Suillus fuscotomentosus TaxID=1912939 RepID=A0AAD4HH32_9AGAM|nr:uncharacterized protein F5891DRAFT_1193123 [Suillus fuscotomentosus]KAG1896323.1 hypothetical protein F5891DRAFT_1193123 [Suillus fuscotomentosus]
MSPKSITLSPVPAQACNPNCSQVGQKSPLSQNISNSIDSMLSARQRSWVQTAAYLLGVRQKLPDVDGEEINRTRTVQSSYEALAGAQDIGAVQELPALAEPELEPERKKVEFRIPLNSMETDKCTTYVGRLYSESDLSAQDLLDSTRATMDVPKTYENLGWRLSTAHRTDPPHRLLNSQDISNAFRAAREQMSGRKKKNVAIEIVNTKPMVKGKSTERREGAMSWCSAGDQKMESKALLLPYGQELQIVQSKLRCSEHRLGEDAAFCWVDTSQPGMNPHYPLCTRDLQEWAKFLHETRDPEDATCLTLPSTPHFDEFRKTRKERTVSPLQRVPTELVSPVIHNHVHISPAINDMLASSNGPPFGQQGQGPKPLKRTYALYMESDEESDDDWQPPQGIDNVLAIIDARYPAMEFPQYVDKLKDRGILYLVTAASFSIQFYEEKIRMPEGAAYMFHASVHKVHIKEERAKMRRNAKGKRKARVQPDDEDKENIHTLE